MITMDKFNRPDDASVVHPRASFTAYLRAQLLAEHARQAAEAQQAEGEGSDA